LREQRALQREIDELKDIEMENRNYSQETSALNLRLNDHPLVSLVNFPGTLLAWRRRFTSRKTGL
jgi:hypothetical protein